MENAFKSRGFGEVLGVVLAGGKSRRMGDVDKTTLKLGGLSLLELAAQRLAPQVDDLIINSNEITLDKFNLHWPIEKDVLAGHLGPLAGILTAMRYGERTNKEWVLSVAADTPFFPKDLGQALKPTNNHEIALARSGGFRHPTFGYWSVSLAESLEDFLRGESKKKIMMFVEQHSWEQIEFEFGEGAPDPFFNVNTPEDFELALRLHNNG